MLMSKRVKVWKQGLKIKIRKVKGFFFKIEWKQYIILVKLGV